MKIDGTKIYSTTRDYQVKYSFNIKGHSRDGTSDWFISAAEAVFRASELARNPNIKSVDVYEHYSIPKSKLIATGREGSVELVGKTPTPTDRDR